MHDEFEIGPFTFHVYRGTDEASIVISLLDVDSLEEQDLPIGCSIGHAKVVGATLAAKYLNVYKFRLYEFIKDLNLAEIVA